MAAAMRLRAPAAGAAARARALPCAAAQAPLACHARRRLGPRARAAGGDGSNGDGDGEPAASTGIPAGLLLFVSSAAFSVAALRNQLGDLLAEGGDGLADATLLGLGLGDLAGAALWAVALWYVSPLQLLLAFIGRFDVERPSDWIIAALGRATGQPVDAIDYVAPASLRAAAALACGAGGVATAAALGLGLGDPTWAVSSGLGALFAGAIFEAGRPARLSVAEAQALEAQWQDFAAFAEASLQRRGRCHESEVFAAFRRRHGKYRSGDAITDATLRDMVRNWHPGVERTRTGYLRNLSVAPPGGPGAAPAAAAGGGRRLAAQQAGGSGRESGSESGSESDGERSLLDNIAAEAERAAVGGASGGASGGGSGGGS
ncbi:hypothetical protein HT031_003208 [Scenedesmus sp. PABB004]|nr:hypothetical protein HT031_003208 [Scenedesmus sp. PABB004]